mgnify:CR=1 FL=1
MFETGFGVLERVLYYEGKSRWVWKLKLLLIHILKIDKAVNAFKRGSELAFLRNNVLFDLNDVCLEPKANDQPGFKYVFQRIAQFLGILERDQINYEAVL